MKALILCAGQGTRLLPLTQSVPKCLVKAGDRPILAHELAALEPFVDEIVLATGYLAEEIRSFTGESCTTVHNPDYASTNSLYSLWLARDVIAGHPFVLLNGDLVFDRTLLAQLLQQPAETALLVDDRPAMRDGEMNVVIRDGLIVEIGKHIEAARADALSLQIARFSASDGELLLQRVDELVGHGQTGGFPALAYDAVIGRSRLVPVLSRTGLWFEVDTLEDLSACDQALVWATELPA